MSVTSEAPAQADEQREWWQRVGDAWQRWADRHGTAVRRLRLARSIWLWASLAWLLVLLVVRDDLRESVRVFAQVYWLLIVWFVLTRTRTVSWRLVAGVFTVGVVWSAIGGKLLYELAQQVDAVSFASVTVEGQVRGFGPMVALAGVGEESLKLVPLAVLALVAPGRVRRFAVTDWLLLGFASGLAFQAFEELARRTAANVLRPGLAELLLGVGNRGPETGFPQYGWGPSGGWARWGAGTEFPGHHAMTALVAVAVGLGLVAWRHAGRRGGPAALAWRALAVVAPVAMWWIVVSVHAGANASTMFRDRWLTAENPSVPWLIRTGWEVGNHGVGLRWLLLVLLLVALLVDARHLHTGDRTRTDGGMLALPFRPALVTESWTGRLAGDAPAPVLGVVGAACALVAYAARDVIVLLAGHAREPGEPLRRALLRGRVAGSLVRVNRAETLALAVRPGTAGRRLVVRAAGLVALVFLVWAAVRLGPAWADRIGRTPQLRSLAGVAPWPDVESWLAGLFDALAVWWDSQSPATQLAIGFGIAALVGLSGGSLAVAFGVSGVATYFLDHSRGTADFIRDPERAVDSYLRTATPQSMLLDGAEAFLTFAPSNFAGAATGRGLRVTIEEFARDPGAWLATRRALLRDDRGAIDLAAFLRRDPIQLADGTMASALDPADVSAFNHWYDSLERRPLSGSGAAQDYQVHVYGDSERVVWSAKPRSSIADGSTGDYGAIGDAKYRGTENSSFLDPASMPEGMRQNVIDAMDDTLLKYDLAVQDPGTPARLVEIVTNDPAVAEFVESRLRFHSIPGYVRIVPWSPP